MSPIRRLNFFSFFYMFFVSLPVFVPYTLEMGLTLAEILELQGAFAISVALLEIPTGSISDRIGRKKTLMVGGFFYGLAFTLLALANGYWSLMLFELVCALGMSLVSGTDIALLYEHLGNDRTERTKALSNLQLSQQVAEAFGSILGGLAAIISLRTPFIVQAVVGWMPLLIALTLKEGSHEPPPRGQHISVFFKLLKQLFFEANKRIIFLNLVLWSLSTFYAVWLLQKFWIDQDVSIGFFGLLWAGFSLITGFSGKLAVKLNEFISRKNILLIAGTLPILSYLGMSFMDGYLAVAMGSLLYVSRGFIQVHLKEMFNDVLPSNLRATGNSIQSFVFRGGFAITTPLLGLITDEGGPRLAFMILAVFFSMIYLLFLIRLPKHI